MKKSRIIFLLFCVFFISACQTDLASPQDETQIKPYEVTDVTVTSKVPGVEMHINKAYSIIPEWLDLDYTIINNSKEPIERGKYYFTIRGYSETNELMFEAIQPYIFNSTELDPGKNASHTSSFEIFNQETKVDNLMMIFERDWSWN